MDFRTFRGDDRFCKRSHKKDFFVSQVPNGYGVPKGLKSEKACSARAYVLQNDLQVDYAIVFSGADIFGCKGEKTAGKVWSLFCLSIIIHFFQKQVFFFLVFALCGLVSRFLFVCFFFISGLLSPVLFLPPLPPLLRIKQWIMRRLCRLLGCVASFFGGFLFNSVFPPKIQLFLKSKQFMYFLKISDFPCSHN